MNETNQNEIEDHRAKAHVEARQQYLVEHRKCLDRIMNLARMQEATTAALSSAVIFLFNLASTGNRMPGAISPNSIGGIDLDAPDQRGGPAAYRITADGQVQRLVVPEPDVAVTLADEPAGESKLRMLRGDG